MDQDGKQDGRTEGTLAAGTEDASVPEQMRVRLEKRQRLLDEGVDPYPVGFPRTATIAEVRERYPDLEPDTYTGDRVGVTGRVMLSRSGGKLSFATIRDGTGDIQVMISLDRVGPDALAAWKRDVDLGDHIGVEGEVISSRRGELSILADRYAITAKGLRPLPEKHRGLSDAESRVRHRYVDLIVNPDARRMAGIRAAVIQSIRSDLHQRGFLEVETPVLQTVHGGANARPFVTRINAYNMELFLRIALELHLKRLIVGGIEKVYEIGRIFRNEGVDSTHNPEFTMLEAYEAYGDYDSVATLTRELIQNAAVAAYGAPVARRAGQEYDLSGGWPAKTVYGAISEALGAEIDPGTSEDRLRKLCAQAGVPAEPGWGHGQIVLEMYERLVEERTVEPTFYRDFPVERVPADPGPPGEPAPGRALGPGRVRHRARHRVLGAGQPGRGTPQAHRPVAAGRGRRPRGHAAGRGLPAGARVRDAADRRRGRRHRPGADHADRREHPGDDPVPPGPAAVTAVSRCLPHA